jgi:hypothetical protein
MPIWNFITDDINSKGIGAQSTSDNSWEVSLAELMNGYRKSQHSSWQNLPFTDVLMHNIKANGFSAMGQVVAGVVVKNVLKKTGVFRNLNKVNKMVGIEKVARWS